MAQMSGWPAHYRWMVPILLLAFLLRIAYLDTQGLWWDEAFSFSLSNADLRTLLEDAVHDKVHPPLYYVLMHFWLMLGHEEYLLRFFSVLWGVISVSVMYVAGSTVGGKRLGALAALLLAVSPFNVWYSQEVRMYSLTTMLVLAASVSCLRLLRADTMTNWVAYGLLSLLALYSEYLYLLVVLGHGVFLVVLRRRYPAILRKWISCMMVVGVLFLPWLLAVFTTGGFYSASISWISPARLSDLFWTLYSLTVGLTTDPRHPLYLAAALIALSLVGYGLVSGRPRKEQEKVMVVSIWLVLPLLLTFVISLNWPLPQRRSIYIDRFFNPLLPAFLILVALGIQRAVSAKGARRAISALGLAVLVIATGSSMHNLYYDDDYARDQWREAIAYVNARSQPEDLVLVRPHDYAPLYYYQLEGVDWLTVPYLESTAEYDAFLSDEVAPAISDGGSLWTLIVCENGNAHRFVQDDEQRLMERVRGDELRQALLARYRLQEEREYTRVYLASYDGLR
jgi:mannosyltransferase